MYLHAFDANGVRGCAGLRQHLLQPLVDAPGCCGGDVGSTPAVATTLSTSGPTSICTTRPRTEVRGPGCSGSPKTCRPLWTANTGGKISQGYPGSSPGRRRRGRLCRYGQPQAVRLRCCRRTDGLFGNPKEDVHAALDRDDRQSPLLAGVDAGRGRGCRLRHERSPPVCLRCRRTDGLFRETPGRAPRCGARIPHRREPRRSDHRRSHVMSCISVPLRASLPVRASCTYDAKGVTGCWVRRTCVPRWSVSPDHRSGMGLLRWRTASCTSVVPTGRPRERRPPRHPAGVRHGSAGVVLDRDPRFVLVCVSANGSHRLRRRPVVRLRRRRFGRLFGDPHHLCAALVDAEGRTLHADDCPRCRLLRFQRRPAPCLRPAVDAGTCRLTALRRGCAPRSSRARCWCAAG